MARTRASGEHRVQIKARGGAAVPVDDQPTPEKQLNCFVRSVVLVERLGNALGTLAFTWATVVLLGGYPTVLSPKDFWFVTAIVFLEAARMFSRNNRLDYQLFFYTRGAVRPVRWNELLVIVCLSNVVLNMLILMRRRKRKIAFSYVTIPMLIITAAIYQLVSLGVPKLWSETLRRYISLWSPLLAIILLAPAKPYGNHDYAAFKLHIFKWMVFLLLFLIVLLLTVSRLRYQRISGLLDCAVGRKLVSWRRLTLNWCIIFVLIMVVFVQDAPSLQGMVVGYDLYALLLVLFGNFQFPVAIGRIVLALMRLLPHDYFGGDDKTNLGPSLCIFYGMVFGQGALYIIACLLEVFSFFPRRFLARRVKFRGQWGVECINLYYTYAFEKYMNGDVFASKKIRLHSFAIDSLHSDLRKMQLHGVRILHCLLQREMSKTRRIFSKLSTSTETMDRLIKMMDWMSPEESNVRFFATMVTVELSKSLRVATVPGIVQIVSALLSNGNHHKRGRNPLQDTDDEQEEAQDSVLNAAGNVIQEGSSIVSNSGYLLETQQNSIGQLGIVQRKCWMLRCWQRTSECWAVLEEEPFTGQDLLPALGMTIIEHLAAYDEDNCLEIGRATGLIGKIIGFTKYCRTDTAYTSTQRNILAKSSLKLLHTLTGIVGEIGTTLRHNISRYPFLYRNLAEILRDSTSSPEMRKLVAAIIRNLAVDLKTRQMIGRIQVMINGLMQIFLMPDASTNSYPLLRKVAGQALAMLAMDSVDNCLAMLSETRFPFIKELTGLLHLDRYRCVSASLLRSMCLNTRHQLQVSDLQELSHVLREVLERILIADRAELEILVGLSSQICKAVPHDFANEIEHGQIKETFVKWLVGALNVDMELSDGCHGISRSILEQAIHMMEYNSGYVTYFKDHHMWETLLIVEEASSGYVNNNFVLGDAGPREAGEPLSSLVARAKRLLAAS